MVSLFELSEPESPRPRDRREEESDVVPETETDEDDREPRKRSKREGLARMTKSRVQRSDADVYDSINVTSCRMSCTPSSRVGEYIESSCFLL